MKYLRLFENAPSIGNSEVQFTSKNQKLDDLKDQINGLLSTISDKKIGYNYAVGSKGIYFTTSDGQLVTETGFGCITYDELLSNLEVILFTLKHMNANPVTVTEEPIEVLPPSEPTNDIKQDVQSDSSFSSNNFEIPDEKQIIQIPIAIATEIESFERFRKN